MEKARAEIRYLELLLEKKWHDKEWYKGLNAAWFFSGIFDADTAHRMIEKINEAFKN